MTKTQIAILWGMSVLVVVVFALLSRALAQPPDPVAAMSAPEVAAAAAAHYLLPQVPHSARGFHARADQAARTWQGDAQMVSALASWSFATLDDFSKPVEWTYQFYSPSTHRLYVVAVGADHVIPIVATLSPYALRVVDDEQWRVDSHTALNAWLEHGGGALLEGHSIVDVSAKLVQAESGRPEWKVVGAVRDQEMALQVGVDAESGQVVN